MTQPSTNGPIHAVTCPHCGKHNDFRPINEQQLLDTGSHFDCDHCGRIMTVTGVRPVTLVTVVKARAGSRSSRPALAPARQATTLSPAATRRLLGRGPRR